MEYEFINDPITGSVKANFSLEHEIMGPWLEVEVGGNANKLTELLSAINDVGKGLHHQVMIIGHEYSIEISRADVVVKNNAGMNGTSAELPVELSEEFENYDQNSEASCGTEDFKALLMSWARFINN
tara:strand:- start:511 stop:891 length:381 start_codon:yes stop_codon:yes gene_type:complete